MAATWRVFGNKIALQPDKVRAMTLAACALHNYLLDNKQICPTVTADDNSNPNPATDGMGHLAHVARPSADSARDVRDNLCHYVNNEGAVAWQEDMI